MTDKTRLNAFGREVCEECGYTPPQHAEDCYRPQVEDADALATAEVRADIMVATSLGEDVPDWLWNKYIAPVDEPDYAGYAPDPDED